MKFSKFGTWGFTLHIMNIHFGKIINNGGHMHLTTTYGHPKEHFTLRPKSQLLNSQFKTESQLSWVVEGK